MKFDFIVGYLLILSHNTSNMVAFSPIGPVWGMVPVQLPSQINAYCRGWSYH